MLRITRAAICRRPEVHTHDLGKKLAEHLSSRAIQGERKNSDPSPVLQRVGASSPYTMFFRNTVPE